MKNYIPKTKKQIQEDIKEIKGLFNRGFYKFCENVINIEDEFAPEKAIFANETIEGFYKAVELFTALRENARERAKNREAPNFQINKEAVSEILAGFEFERDPDIRQPRIYFRKSSRYREFERLFNIYSQIAGISNRFAQQKADLADETISRCYGAICHLISARESAEAVLKELEEDRKANAPYPFNNLEELINQPEPVE